MSQPRCDCNAQKRWRTCVRHRVEIVLGLKETTSSLLFS
jgi:hypothetical protein